MAGLVLLGLSVGDRAQADEGAMEALAESIRSELSRAVSSAERPRRRATHRNAGRRARRDRYARFPDGPRRVPVARGASKARAEALGLGTYEAAKDILKGKVATRWIAAIRGKTPEDFHWPVDGGHYGRGFGFVRKTRPDLRHNGVDIGAKEGATVRAVADGIVAYSDNGIRGFGNCVIVLHKNGWSTVYAHNYRNTVQAGWRVKKGERIAFVGKTGIARGPHLHFELRANGRPRDPMPFLRRGKSESPERAAEWRAREADASAFGGAAVDCGEDELVREAESDGEGVREGERGGDGERVRDSESESVADGNGSLAAAREVLGGHVSEALRASVASARTFSTILWPVRGGRGVSRGFSDGHRALDIEAEPGTAVRAALDGVVVFAGEGLEGLGQAVVMLHPDDRVTVYGSNRSVSVKEGDVVLRGQWIAEVGASGLAETAHLHFELRKHGELLDPTALLAQVPPGR